MMNNKIKISALVLTLCIGASIFTSCGGNKDTTHDAGSDDQVVTDAKTEAKTENKTESNNKNGMIGEAVTDVTRGARDIVGGIAEGTRDMMGGTHDKASNNNASNNMTNNNAMNGSAKTTTDNRASTTRTLPKNGK